MEGEGVGSLRVESIYVYPVKSCRGISVPQAPLFPTGFRWDRNWLVVNSRGRAYTQRVEPKLALVEVHLPPQAFSPDWLPTSTSFMVLNAPGMPSLRIPLTRPSLVAHGVSVWEWSGSALDEGQDAANWLSTFLGKPGRLVRFNTDSETRIVDPNYALGHKVFFADLFPFLLISKGSLDALNTLLKDPVPINRFRPNILVDGCEPFSEDLWTEIRINKATFEGVKLCSRCKIPTINQDTGVAGSEPNETLKKFRSDEVLRPSEKQQGKIYFGMNMVWKDYSGRGMEIVKVGDPVFVIRKVLSAAEAAA